MPGTSRRGRSPRSRAGACPFTRRGADMRTAVVACVAFVVVAATLLISGVLSSVVGGNQQGTILQANFVCNAGLGPMQGQDANKGKADAGRLNEQALTMAALIVSIGKQ